MLISPTDWQMLIKNILCIVDLESKTPVYQQASVVKGEFLARCFDARLHLFALVYSEHLAEKFYHDPELIEQGRSEYLNNISPELNDAATQLSASGIEVKCDVVWSHPHYETLIHKAEGIGADLIIKTSLYRRHMDWACFSTNDWRLIAQSQIPVLLTRSSKTDINQAVIAAIDPTHQNDKSAVIDHEIMKMSEVMSFALQGDLHVFHSYYDSSAFLGPVSRTNYLPEYAFNSSGQVKSLLEEQLDDFLSSYSVPDDKVHLRVGGVKEQLQTLASELDAGIVVMGAVSRSQWKRLFIGLTAERVLNSLTCDVLVVKAALLDGVS